MEQISITRDESKSIRNKLKKEGWLSAHYWTRHGWNVDGLRSKAKKGELKAKVICTDGFTTTWYYHESDIANLSQGSK